MAKAKKKKKDGLDAVLSSIEKNLGHTGTKKRPSPFARYGDVERVDLPCISFGIKDIDDASNCGGIQRGKMAELFGPESSGKSLLTLKLIAQAQSQGMNCALLDIEQSFDPNWAAKHGVDVPNLVYANDFSCGEEALEYAYQLCGSGAIGLLVLDSTAALIPRSELEGTLEDNARVGEQARLISRACRKIVDACAKGNCTCIFINQLRMKIGGVSWGNPETTPGGRALKFYSHQRLRVYPLGKMTVEEPNKDGKTIKRVIGQKSAVTFVKNKLAPPGGQSEFQIIFDETALNPVVMLGNALKSAGMVFKHSGLLKIKKEVYETKSAIDTSSTTMAELADWMIKEDKVLDLLDRLIEKLEEDFEDQELDAAILEMKEDPSKIVSPTGNVDSKRLEDAPKEELDAETDGGDFEDEEVTDITAE